MLQAFLPHIVYLDLHPCLILKLCTIEGNYSFPKDLNSSIPECFAHVFISFACSDVNGHAYGSIIWAYGWVNWVLGL